MKDYLSSTALLVLLCWVVQVQSFWTRRYHASVFTGDWIYIDGGEIADDNGKYDRDNFTSGIDLSKDWTNSSLELTRTERPKQLPSLNSEALWFDDERKIFYSFGGIQSDATDYLRSLDSPSPSIGKFSPDGQGGGVWNEAVGLVGSPFPQGITAQSNGAAVSDGSTAYALGGWTRSDNYLRKLWAPGLLSFDMADQTITNSSDGGYVQDYTHPGTMINIPNYGSRGILIVLGGGNYNHIRGFNNITIYDKGEQKWFYQVATGDIPRPRAFHCAVGVQSKGGSTFEIFIHGGVVDYQPGPDAANSDQMYILSIPAFRWFLAKYTPSIPRGGHTCHGTNTNQMILIGGVDPRNHTFELVNQDLGDIDPKDPWQQGIGVFDMNSLEFKTSYQAKADPYQPAEVIREYYKVNESNKYPNTWTSSAVKDLIQGGKKPSNSTNNPQISESKAAAAADPSNKDRGSSSSGLSLHVIIGIGVGCAIAGATFAAAIVAFFIFTKRRKQQQRKRRKGIELINLSGAAAEREDYNERDDVESSSFSSGKAADHNKDSLVYSELPAPKKLQEMPNPRTDIIELSDTSKVEIAGKEKKIPPVEVL